MSKEINTRLNVQFTQASTFENITSAENISTSFGKISKWYGEIQKKIDTEATYTDIENLFKPRPYLTFKGTDSFTLGTADGGKWDGIVEYSNDLNTWTTWNGTTTLSSGVGNVLYLRGKNNTRFATSDSNYTNFVFTTTGTIACNGDIRRLLDYENPENTTMASYCYSNMFYGCTSLTTLPALPATTLAEGCYNSMFYGCTALTTVPALPATTLTDSCYGYMFCDCTSLTEAPELPATTLASSCYDGMFYNCTSLTKAPELPATTMATYCYQYMFQNCTSLTKTPVLPATTLASGCYISMFYDCTSLTTLPALPATTLAESCYDSMFEGCTNIKMSTTQTGDYQTQYRIPSTGTGSTATGAMSYMFTSTGGTFKGAPTINTTYYTSNTVVSAS
jgi:hypothetical protein